VHDARGRGIAAASGAPAFPDPFVAAAFRVLA